MNAPAVVRPACKECLRYRNHLGAILGELQKLELGHQDPQTTIAAIGHRLQMLQLSAHGPEGLHDSLDMLVSEFVRSNLGSSLLHTSVMQLMEWSQDRAAGPGNPQRYNVPDWQLGQRRIIFDGSRDPGHVVGFTYEEAQRPKNSVTTFMEFRGRKGFMYPVLLLLLFLAGLSVYFLVR